MSTTTAPVVTDGELATLASRQVELFTRFKKGVYANPSEVLDGIQLLIEGKQPEVIPTVVSSDTSSVISDWQDFYKKFFGLNIDLSGVKIPEHALGFDRLIVVPQGITLNQVWKVCARQFNCWKYTDSDLDSAVPTNNRDPKSGAYAIWVRDVVEADKEMKNLSADDLKERTIKGVTLLERLLLELKYFSETGKHLDISNWTLCSGSRHSGGCVPCVRWLDGWLKVDWYYVGGRYDDLRSRVAVTL